MLGFGDDAQARMTQLMTLGALLWQCERAGIAQEPIRAAFKGGGLDAAAEAFGYEWARKQAEGRADEMKRSEWEIGG